jgi:hypothetical protein
MEHEKEGQQLPPLPGSPPPLHVPPPQQVPLTPAPPQPQQGQEAPQPHWFDCTQTEEVRDKIKRNKINGDIQQLFGGRGRYTRPVQTCP